MPQAGTVLQVSSWQRQNRKPRQIRRIALGLGALAEDPRFVATEARRANAAALIGCIEQRVREEDWSTWQRVMAEHGIVLIAVATLAEVARDPQVLENDGLLALREPLGKATHTVNSPIFVEGEPIFIQDGRQQREVVRPILG